LSGLIACAGSAALSLEGKVAELSKLPETEYMKARREVVRTHKTPAGFLDRELAKRRPKPPKADYLSASKMPAAWVTNPPYRCAQRFAERALAEVPPCRIAAADELPDGCRGPRAPARSQRADARLLPPAAPADMHREGWTGKQSSSNAPFSWVVRQENGVLREFPQQVYWKELLGIKKPSWSRRQAA
jgi:hypothetical protein